MTIDLRTSPISDHFAVLTPWRQQNGLGPHSGVDYYGSPRGAPIISPDAGKVTYSGFGWGTEPGTLGYFTLTDHGDYGLLLGHQDAAYPELVGDVGVGDIIGYVGNSGQSTGAHVHAIMSVKRMSNGAFDFSRAGGGFISSYYGLMGIYYDPDVQTEILGAPIKTGTWSMVTRRHLFRAEIPEMGIKQLWYQIPENGLWVTYNSEAPEFVNNNFPLMIPPWSAVFVVKE